MLRLTKCNTGDLFEMFAHVFEVQWEIAYQTALRSKSHKERLRISAY